MIGFEADQIFLLSEKEYAEYKSLIPKIPCWWWLRSPGNDSDRAAFVNYDGSVYYYGYYIYNDYCCVRPAIKYSLDDKRIDNFIYKCGYTWVIIDEDKRIAVAEQPIGFHMYDEIINEYATSEIRKYLFEWYEARKDI